MEQPSPTLPEAVYALFAESQRVSLRDRIRDAESWRAFPPSLGALIERAYELTATVQQAAVARMAPGVAAGELLTRALAELAQQRARVAHLGQEPEPTRACSDVLRAVQGAMYTLESALCRGQSRPVFLPTYLEAALEVRRYYRELWRFSTVTGEVSPLGVHAALRGAGTRIAVLAGSQVFALLREDDRRAIEQLQRRILDWLRGEREPSDGIAVWRDFSGFAETLRNVNLRAELIAHDRAVLTRVAAVLGDRGDDAILEVSDELRPVRGIDDALDETLTSHPSATTLLRELRRTVARLDVAANPPGVMRG